MIYALPLAMIFAGAGLLASRYRQRAPFAVPLLSDHTKVFLGGCLIFFAICILLWLMFPDIASKMVPMKKR
jgi:hypothetical protein